MHINSHQQLEHKKVENKYLDNQAGTAPGNYL